MSLNDATITTIATSFTAIYSFINILRAAYAFYSTRFIELDNVIKDAVQETWETFVKERKHKNLWSELAMPRT